MLVTTFFLVAIFSNWFCNFEKLNEFGGWASYIAAVLTYIGSSLISVVVYYHTWVQQYKEEQLDYSIDYSLFCDKEIKQFAALEDFNEEKRRYFYEYSDGDLLEDREYEYKEFIIRNYNKTYSLSVEILQVKLTIDKQPPVDCIGDIAVATSFDFLDSIDSQAKGSLLLGISRKLLNAWHNSDKWHTYSLDVIFKCTNSVGNIAFTKYSFVDNDHEVYWRELSKQEETELTFLKHHIHRDILFEKVAHSEEFSTTLGASETQ